MKPLYAVLIGLALQAVTVADDNCAPDEVRPAATSGFSGTGYDFLTKFPTMPPDWDQETFDNIWQVWEEPARSEAAKASPEERRKLAFSHYGLTSEPGSKY